MVYSWQSGSDVLQRKNQRGSVLVTDKTPKDLNHCEEKAEDDSAPNARVDAAKSNDTNQPSNAQLMTILLSMKQELTESKEITSEITAFRLEAKNGMETLQVNVKGLKILESSSHLIKQDQDTLANEVRELRAGFNKTKLEVAEHRKLTGTNIDKIANNMKAAADRVNLDSELQSAINETAKDIVIQGFKPDSGMSELDAGKEFLKDIMGKSDTEIKNLQLLSASFTRTDSDWPAGVLSFQSETSVNNLLKDKRKYREKGLKLKESVPLV